MIWFDIFIYTNYSNFPRQNYPANLSVFVCNGTNQQKRGVNYTQNDLIMVINWNTQAR